MAKSHGKTGAVYVSPTGTGVAVSVLNQSSWTLDRSTDKVETTSFGEANKTYVQGLASLQGTITGFWDSATDPLYAASLSTDGVKLYLYPSTVTPTVYDYGPAWIDTSINVEVGGAITTTANFVANGSWGHRP